MRARRKRAWEGKLEKLINAMEEFQTQFPPSTNEEREDLAVQMVECLRVVTREALWMIMQEYELDNIGQMELLRRLYQGWLKDEGMIDWPDCPLNEIPSYHHNCEWRLFEHVLECTPSDADEVVYIWYNQPGLLLILFYLIGMTNNRGGIREELLIDVRKKKEVLGAVLDYGGTAITQLVRTGHAIFVGRGIDLGLKSDVSNRSGSLTSCIS